MLSVQSLDACYSESQILRGVSLNVGEGDVVALLGRNGVGKSTLLKSIMGLVSTPAGKITFRGKDITAMPAYERARLGIGYVPQGREIFPQLSVAENLKVGLIANGNGKGEVPEYLFELFPILGDFASRKGGDLSGGQQQALAIARALAPGPSLLILDEPTEGIQPSIVEELGEAISKIRDRGLAVLIVEQYVNFAMKLCDYVYVMEKGSIVLEGESGQVAVDDINATMAL